MRKWSTYFSVTVFLFSTMLLAQKPTPQPPTAPRNGGSPYPTGLPQGAPGRNSQIPDGWNVDNEHYRFRAPITRERLAGPENLTKPVTVGELEDILTTNRKTPDAKLAAILNQLALTERASSATVSHWNDMFTGPLSRQAILALADGSAFLSLPANAISATPAPTQVEQRRMMKLIGAYLGKNLAGLPNFLAVRRTTYFEDWPSNVDWPSEQVATLSTAPSDPARLRNRTFFVLGATTSALTFRDGQAMVGPEKSAKPNTDTYSSRLSISGEFGPILSGVLSDAAQSKLFWRGWEQGTDGPRAVFRFEVPQEKSHYAVNLSGSIKAKNEIVGYNGEIAVNPSDGSILRLTVVAQVNPDHPVEAANIAVEYGRVEINGQSYICPVHGVALSKIAIPGVRTKAQNLVAPLQTQLNDISFEQYQPFRADAQHARQSKQD